VQLSGPGFLWGVPVLGGLVSLATVVILARVGGRLLGIRLGWRRTILAGFPGLALGWVAAWSINGQRHGPQTLSWPAVSPIRSGRCASAPPGPGGTCRSLTWPPATG